jgi:Ankyrin repeats (3 copies)/Ankyrin repeats (many copies)
MSKDRPSTSQLPPNPDLRHLKDQAKQVLKTGKVATLAAAFFEVARRYGFTSWPRLKSHVLAQTNAAKLKDAITQNDLHAVQALFAAYPALRNALIGRGGGPLTWAAECRGPDAPSQARLDLVRWLIEDGADVHEGGDAPLMRAALRGSRIPMMDLLVEHGANVNGDCNGGYLILFAPCETLDPDSLAWLLQHGADPNCGDAERWRSKGRRHPGTALDYVLGTYARNKDALNECIHLLQAAGGRSRHDKPGVLATIRGDVDAVRKLVAEDNSLLERRFPALNIGTTGGRMLTLRGAALLHVAAEFGQVEVARTLLDAGADVNALALVHADGIGGQSALFHAATQREDFGLDVVRLLLARGADHSLRCRLPGHYEVPDEVFEGTALDYARRFPGGENQTLAELIRAVS